MDSTFEEFTIFDHGMKRENPARAEGNRGATLRDLGQLVSAVLLIDVIAFGLGALAARYVGNGGYWIGVALAAFVTLSFVFIVAANVVAVWAVRLLTNRKR